MPNSVFSTNMILRHMIRTMQKSDYHEQCLLRRPGRDGSNAERRWERWDGKEKGEGKWEGENPALFSVITCYISMEKSTIGPAFYSWNDIEGFFNLPWHIYNTLYA